MFSATEVGAQLSAAEFEERTDDVTGDGMNAAEAGESGAAQDVRENGFGLVVGGMGDSDFVDVALGDQFGEEAVAGAARGVFKVGFFAASFGFYVGSADMKRDLELLCELNDGAFVGIGGSAAKFVIEVNNTENNTEVLEKFGQQEKQSDGIRAARNRYADAVAGTEPSFFLQNDLETLAER